MEQLKPTVTIGIPAYNEESNIKFLINSLLSQDQVGFNIEHIIVVSDCSTDGTVSEVKSIDDSRILLIENKERLGQSISQNRILDQSKSEVLVLLNADILPSDKKFLQTLIQGLLKYDDIGLVSPDVLPLPAKSFAEKLINCGALIRRDIFLRLGFQNNLFLCHGRARAFSKEFYSDFRWEKTYSEDAFSYLACITKGFKFVFIPETSVIYRSPTNFEDHKKQSNRFADAQNKMSQYFPSELIKKEYFIPVTTKLSVFIKWLLSNPIATFGYMYFFISTRLNNEKNIFAKHNWDPSVSSKKLFE